MRKLITPFLFVVLILCNSSIFADSSIAIQNAGKEGKHLFIFFYKDQSEKTLRLQNVFDQAIQKMGQQAASIKVKADDPSEKILIDKFDLKRSPMPFVVVLAPNGAIMGGFTSFTEEQLKDSISSPGAANCIKALQDRKLVVLCLQNNQTKDNEAAINGVNDFKIDPRFADATEVVIVDPSNQKERKFIDQLVQNTNSSQAVTVLISPPANVVGTYHGPISKTQLISDLEKAASGCCPGGKCGSGCCAGGKCGP